MTARLIIILGLGLALAASAPAQGRNNGPRAAPHLAYVYPAGAQQGTEVTLSLGGQNLADADLARFSGPGLSARIAGHERPLNQKELVALREEIQQLQKKRETRRAEFTPEDEKTLSALREKMARGNNRSASPSLAETLTLILTVTSDAPVGPRELRLQSTHGLSNPLVFHVGTLPEFTAPVMTPTSPVATRGNRSSLQQPSVAPPTRIDVTLPAVVNGQILPGEVDHIRFTARQGQSLVMTARARSLIPYLADAVPGWFQATLALRDATGRELAYNDDFQFLPDPVLVCTIPSDGEYVVEIKDAIYRGREDFVYRLALGELPFIQSVFPLGTNRDQPTTVTLTGWNLPAEQLPIDARHRPPGLFSLSVKQHGQPSNSIRFAVSELPESTEQEPNDPATPAEPFTAPMIINGRIAPPGDRDVFHFRGHAGESVVAEIIARRLDSSLDSRLTLTDADGKTIAANDDHEDQAQGLLTHQADSRLQATLPADGIYRFTVADTQHRGGPGFGYRLVVRAPQPDFALRVTPSAVNLPQAASIPITVFALRQDGFDGDIRLALRDQSGGFRLSGARIPAGQDAVTLTLTAPNEPGFTTLHLLGQAMIAGQPVVREAVAADDTMQAFLYRHLVPSRTWEAAVTGRAVPFRPLTASPLRLQPGVPATIRLSTPGMTRPIAGLKVELLSPPPGMSIVAVDAQTGQLSCQVRYDPVTDQPLSSGHLILSVSGQRRNATGKASSGVVALGFAPAIGFEITAP